MRTRQGARRWPARLTGLLLFAIGAFTTTASTPVAAATHRAAAATPATDLGDQVVRVTWQGFRPTLPDGTYSVVVMQCRAHPRSAVKDCNTGETFPYSLNGNQQQGTTSRDGTGSVFMDIMTTARLPALACSETTPCSLMVYETTTNGFDINRLPPNRVFIPLVFKRNSADCPPVRAYNFSIETEASAAPALYHWAADVCTGAHAYTVGITNTSSTEARDDYLSRTVDVAISSLPPAPSETRPPTRAFSVVPLDLTAVVFAYNITDPVTHKRITDLTLTPRLAARLLSDSSVVSFFEDREFRALNPHHSWPIEAAAPGIRGERNADTWIVTKWIDGNLAARAFLNGHDRYHVPVNPAWRNVHYPTDVFQARDSNGVYFPREGEEGVAERLFSGTQPADSIPTDPLDAGFIGILDLPTALRYQLPIARLTNGVGKPVVDLNLFSLAAGYHAMTTTRAGFHLEPEPVSDATAYPLTKVDHAMVQPTLSHSAKDLRIRALVDYAVTTGQETLPPGYAPLPGPLQLQGLRYTGDTSLLQTASPSTTTTTTTPAPLFQPAHPPTGDSDLASPLPTGAPHSRARTTTSTTRPAPTTQRRATTFVALHVGETRDHLFPALVLGIGTLALLAWGADVARQRAEPWVRRRHALRRVRRGGETGV